MGPIIRTCSAALPLLLAAQPAVASPDGPLTDYLRARIAAADGRSAEAVRGFSAALGERPDDAGLALRAWQEAVVAGDWALLLHAGRRLEALGAAPAELPLAMLADAVARGDRAGADRAVALLAAGRLDFLAPAVRGWLAAGRGEDGAAALRDARGTLATRYAEAEAAALSAARPGRVRAGLAGLLLRFARDMGGLDVPLLAGTLRAAERLAPDDTGVARQLARRLATIDAPDAALAVLARHPDAAVADLAVGILLAEERTGEALARAETAARGRRAPAAAIALLGHVQSLAGDDAAAAASYARALTARDLAAAERPGLLAAQGSALAATGRWDAAAPLLEAAATAGSANATVLNNVGYAYLERGERARGAVLIERAAALDPDDPEIADSLGWARFLSGDVPGAIAALEGAAQARPADPEINEHLGDAYHAAGRRREARFAWTAAALWADAEAGRRLQAKIAGGPAAR